MFLSAVALESVAFTLGWPFHHLGSFKLPEHACFLTGEDNGNSLQYSCLENPMDRGAWYAAVHGDAKSIAQLSNFTFTFHFPALEKEMATHSSVLAWRIPGTEEPGRLPSMGSHRVRHDWSNSAAAEAACFLTPTPCNQILMWLTWDMAWTFMKMVISLVVQTYNLAFHCCITLMHGNTSTILLSVLQNSSIIGLLRGFNALNMKVKSLSCVQFFVTPWTVAYQGPPSMGFSRQEYWSGSLLQGIFPTQGSNLSLPHCRQMLLPSEPPGKFKTSLMP